MLLTEFVIRISQKSRYMKNEISREWWKIKVYNEVSEYLKYPSAMRKLQLQTALAEYEKMFNQLNDINNNCFHEMELTMNHF